MWESPRETLACLVPPTRPVTRFHAPGIKDVRAHLVVLELASLNSSARVEGDHKLELIGCAGALSERPRKVHAVGKGYGGHQDNPDRRAGEGSHDAISSRKRDGAAR